MKVLVTGGTGRIGANLAKSLLGAGHGVRVLAYPGDAGRTSKLDVFGRVETVVGTYGASTRCLALLKAWTPSTTLRAPWEARSIRSTT